MEKEELTFYGLPKARLKMPNLSANTKLKRMNKTTIKDFARAFGNAMLAAVVLFIAQTCSTKDTPSFVLKNRGAVFIVSVLKSLSCLLSVKLSVVCRHLT